ncbi:type IV secretion system DNA-binding domain-containing protein [Acidithiobacillus sp. IBUN Pt1247-S3]|uniref:type IV secretion system DNA-binding domain-containing protein n=1 Tax=Acidithiobacillus sp. IBUN Pt1247-S3 TaxID=3166642 RepID=UPI0034E5739A
MPQPDFRVQGDEQFIEAKKLRRHITPMHTEVANLVLSPLGASVSVAMLGAVSAVFPILCMPSALLSVGLMGITALRPSVRRATLPLRLPAEEAGRTDYNAPTAQHRGFREADGSVILGNVWGARKEIWASFGDLLTHCLVLGGTGAGKTEQLLSMVYNALAMGGGSVYVDPKGGPKLLAQHWTMLRLLGRDDDLRVLNFALGTSDLKKSPVIRSNTMQPFAFGKASSLKEIPLSLMASGGSGNGGSIFESNAKTLITALVMLLVDLRNMGEISFSINDMRKYIQPDAFIELAKRKDTSKETQEAAINFLLSMGWKPNEKDPSKWGDFSRQYSYAQNYFLDLLSTLSDTYRHVFNVPVGDIHMPDVIFQRRCLVAIVPALEKSKAELNSLGRITLMLLRLGVAAGLGEGDVMGRWRKLVDLSLSAARVPAFLFIDEYAAINVEGFAEVFTQGRGLGVSATVGSQDWAGIKKANEAEAQQIVANTKFKFIMTTDDPNDTRQLVESLSGDALEMQSQAYSQQLLNYYDTQSATAQRTKRTDQKDFAAQVEGEWHLFYKEKIIRGFSFFAGGVPKNKESASFVHHFLMAKLPGKNAISLRFGDLKKTMDEWKRKIREAGSTAFEIPENPAEHQKDFAGFLPMAALFYWVLRNPDAGRAWAERQRRDLACAAVYAWMQQDAFALSRQMLEEKKAQMGKETAATRKSDATPSVEASAKTVTESDKAVPEGVEPESINEPSAGVAENGSTPPQEAAPTPTAQDRAEPDAEDVDWEDDPLAAMERQSGLVTTAEVSAETETRETQEEASPSDAGGEETVPVEGADAKTRPEPAVSTPSEPSEKHPDLPEEAPKEDGISALSRALFSTVEEQVESGAETWQNAARILGATEEDAQALPKRMVDEVRKSMQRPPYPVPPKPEKKSASELRPLAERWVQRIKGT